TLKPVLNSFPFERIVVFSPLVYQFGFFHVQLYDLPAHFPPSIRHNPNYSIFGEQICKPQQFERPRLQTAFVRVLLP
ncbi:MAG TPA: hypothetical protein VGJ73_09195, partial [Verrucomicrobiae bacterium]